jgi:hypothetical protein
MHHGDMNCEMDMGKCDMDRCKTMTKDECAAYCDSLGCSAEQKAECLSMYGADGKFDEAKCKEMCGEKMKGKENCDKGCKTMEECEKSCDDKCVASHKAGKGCCNTGESDHCDH